MCPVSMASVYATHVAAAAAAHEARRRVAAARITEFGVRMRARSLKRLDRSFVPLELGVGERVRVSMLVLAPVRRLMKSALAGGPLPHWSTDMFTVARRRERHGRTVYDVACDGEADPAPAWVNGQLAQLPSCLRGVERRYLLRVPPGTVPTMGRAHPGVAPAHGAL